MKSTSSTSVIIALLALTGCPGDDTPATSDTDATGTSTGATDDGPSVTTTDATTTGITTGLDSSSDGGSTDGEESSSSGEPPPPPEAADFTVTIENISNTGLMFSPMSPGMWANHEPNADGIFQTMVADDGEGLEALAEDGDPTALAAAVAGHDDVAQAEVFDTPVGADAPGPLLPGDTYEFTFTAEPGTRLSLATMLVGSNDMFVASGPVGISLFAGGGQPLNERDVSSSLRIWDAGTEYDQAPGQGPMQAVHGGSPDMGPSEAGGVSPFNHSTRALPLGPDLIQVEVDDDPDPKNPGSFIITITNISSDRGTLVSPLTPIVWALHNDAIALFEEGMPASAELESLAEDGNASGLAALFGGSADVEASDVLDGPDGIDSPIGPGQSVTFNITPNVDFPYLTLATMVAQTNDAFLAAGQVGDAPIAGIPLFDGATLRDNQDIEADILAHLTPWDAGTELNEVPGVGVNQAPRQAGPNTGLPDAKGAGVLRYSDVTNDLTGPGAGGFVTVTVLEVLGDYTITVTNTSGTSFPGVLTPTLWALHDDTVGLFEMGMPASPGLEMLAEDGDPTGLLGEVMGMAGFGGTGVADTPVGAGAPGPLFTGESYTFTVTPDADNRFLSFATMIVPSNDTFAALDAAGVALLNADGSARLALDVQTDIAAALIAWDAGTEGNQAGAAGRDMAPGVADTGPTNGTGLVRESDENEIWSMPAAEDVVRVIVAPAGR